MIERIDATSELLTVSRMATLTESATDASKLGFVRDRIRTSIENNQALGEERQISAADNQALALALKESEKEAAAERQELEQLRDEVARLRAAGANKPSSIRKALSDLVANVSGRVFTPRLGL